MIPGDLLITSTDKFIIEIFLPSIDFNKLNVIEDLVGNLHTVISGLSHLLLISSSKS